MVPKELKELKVERVQQEPRELKVVKEITGQVVQVEHLV